MRHTISLTVADEYGMLSRVAGLFSARGYQIDTLCVAPTLDEGLSRMTLTTHGNDQVIDQILKQLEKLVKVYEVHDLTKDPHVEREMMLVTVSAERGEHRQEVLSLVEIFRAKVVDVSDDAFIIEMTGNAEKVDALIDLLRPIGIRDMVRTGTVAMTRVAAVKARQARYEEEETFSELTLNEKV
ncbi:MAG TPA: acetolactate synthase small subunit [Blastocatellia bacterium]|nr:acetolactate synthase small subunit [Blastocatellia bacterium]